ncbi:hypothetical protein GCM10010458_36790 [Microbacterium luteolum]|uniref:Uncharacterized protein n=1 Tax=Microbacterium luteolum TaxID=69367 RepID=A0ABY7XKM3_MICLT|nr:hypothetical protein [Microbacterium luteolum]WDM42542.1 hypothetical protein KV395_04325 [Microbacterium luteolum]
MSILAAAFNTSRECRAEYDDTLYAQYESCRGRSRRSRTAELWVQFEASAADAIQFAAAAERAYRSHEVQERSHRIRCVRCPECQQQMIWHPPAWFVGHVTVKCSNDECRHVMDQDEFEELEKTA